MVELALGKTKSYVFENKYDSDYINSISNKDLYKVGDIIYFKDTDTPDQWVCGIYQNIVNGSYYEFSNVKVESPDLDGYEKTIEAERKYVTKTQLQEINLNKVGGGDDEYIDSITQSGGRVSATVKKLNISKVATDLDLVVLKQAKEYTDERVGDLTDSDGNQLSVRNYVDTKVVNQTASLVDKLNQLTQTVSTHETSISEIKTDVEQIKATSNTNTLNIQGINTRLSNLEKTVAAGGGSGGTIVTGITTIKVGGVALEKDLDNAVDITNISTDLLTNGVKTLVIDAN